MLGGGRREVVNAVSQAFVDGAGLRVFRHYPNNGTRKGWAAGDAAAGVAGAPEGGGGSGGGGERGGAGVAYDVGL